MLSEVDKKESECDHTCADDQDLIVAGEAVGEIAVGFRVHGAALSRCQLVILQRHRWAGSREEAVCTRTQLRLEPPKPLVQRVLRPQRAWVMSCNAVSRLLSRVCRLAAAGGICSATIGRGQAYQ